MMAALFQWLDERSGDYPNQDLDEMFARRTLYGRRADGVQAEPIRGSEDDERELTPDQRNTYRWIKDAYDAAWIDRVLPTGVVWVVAQRGASISHIELSREGIPI